MQQRYVKFMQTLIKSVKSPEVIDISILSWLQRWYEAQCDGDWEHSYGINIQTLDNPGWSLKISLVDIKQENKDFSPVQTERNENDWIHCRVKDGYFEGYGGPKNLEELISTFKKWVEEQS